MVLAGCGQIDVVDKHHLVYSHFIFYDRNFWEVAVIEAAKYFVHIHFSNALGRVLKAVVGKVEAQCLGDVCEGLANSVELLLAR